MSVGQKRPPDACNEVLAKKPRLGSESSDTVPETASLAASPAASSPFPREKKYRCHYEGCDKAFDRPVRLQTHIRTHEGDRAFECQEPGCTKSFFRSEHLKAHMKNKHSDDAQYVCEHVVSVDETGTERQCGKAFTTTTRLRRHLATHEQREGMTCQEPGCGQVFRKAQTLERHILKEHRHEKAFDCPHTVADKTGLQMKCGESFNTASQLASHETREHSGPRYFCDVCPAAENDPTNHLLGFGTYTEYQLHNKSVHPPVCTTCGKACETKRALAAHMDIEHSSLEARQKFFCDAPGCGRGFTRKGNLAVHVRNVHVKQREYICGQFSLSDIAKCAGWDGNGCGAAFGSKAILVSHVRTQHLGLPGEHKLRKERRRLQAAQSVSGTEDVESAFTPSEPATDRPNHAMDTMSDFAAIARPLQCLEPGCQHRFSQDSNLAYHLEFLHGWTEEEMYGTVLENNALAGGDFWVGGLSDDETMKEEERLRIGLQLALNERDADFTTYTETQTSPQDVKMLDAVLDGPMDLDPDLMVH